MKRPNQTVFKLFLENQERIQHLGVQHDPVVDHYVSVCFSRLNKGEVALKAAQHLSTYLDRVEWIQAKGSHDVKVPALTSGLSILIGKTLDGQDYCLSGADICTPTVITGASGGGKSTLIANIVAQGVAHVPVVLFDHKDEGSRFLSLTSDSHYVPLSKLRWNLLKGEGNQEDYLRFWVTQLARTGGLVRVTSFATQATLPELCHNRNDLPAVVDLAEVFENLSKSSKRSNLQTAARAIQDLASCLGQWAQVRKGLSPIPQAKLTIFPFKDVPGSIENFFISIFFKQLMDNLTASGHDASLKRLIIFDEGRGFFGKEHELPTGAGRINIQTTITTQSRSYGLGTIVAFQSALTQQSSLLDNAGTFIALRANSEAEAKFLCRRFAWPESRYPEFMQLKVGEAIVTSPRCLTPTLVKVPYLGMGRYLTKAEVDAHMRDIYQEWDSKCTFAPSASEKQKKLNFRDLLTPPPRMPGEQPPPATTQAFEPSPMPTETDSPKPTKTANPLAESPLTKQLVEFVTACSDHPDFGVTQIYNELSLSASVGRRIQKAVIQAGYLTTKSAKSPKGGRPKTVFILTHKGTELIT